MITLYNTASSPNGQRVRIMLAEASIPYREIILRRHAGENRAPDYLRLSPGGTVPAITDDETGVAVFESSAVLVYLAEKAQRFLPTAQPARSDVFKWLFFATANIDPACENICELSYLDDSRAQGALPVQRQKLQKATTLVDAQLAQHAYVAGDCSIADFALFSWLVMLEDFADVPSSHFPNITRWRHTMHDRPGVRAALTCAVGDRNERTGHTS